MTTNLHDKMLAAIDAYFSASDAVEEEVAENLLLDVRDEILKHKRAEQPAQQEHVTDGSPCWCNPELDYKDPDTGAEVWIHKEPQ